jgi:HAD superfamily hydrolase (TIGR01509 family)
MSVPRGPFRHIIFDNDGVLIDSEHISMRIDQRLLAECGVVMSHAELTRRFVGKTFRAMIAEMETERGMTFPADLESRKDVLMIEAYRRDLQAVPGVIPALERIKLPKSVASNGPRDRIDVAFGITGLAKYFEGRISTFEEVRAGKPAPDVYLLAARRAGVAPEECLVVEDSPTGVAAAHAAGCRVLGFTGTAIDKEMHAAKLRAAGAFAVFDDMTELHVLIC